ncbi:putative clathrin assembly protein At5g35200 isoform X1 [Lotus japonicus]|uniref:putative clathrin assembly protein At5g35200 isoform X1 n=1 Tax=Lotus japonicus TaxID=34305 RepID=UPI0025909EFC|nr:putative clathrin assembly protein At5g35200 isoform X1 [Lotus japonicus]
MKKKVKSHGEYKLLDAAILKATNSDNALPKEKHIRTIFQSLSPSKPRREVDYCIDGLNMRFGQTSEWAVALKVMIIFHRAMRELDKTVMEQFASCSNGGCLIDLANFTVTNKPPGSEEYCNWMQEYHFYLEDRVKCFTTMNNHDVVTISEKHTQKLSTQDLLVQLPALQRVLFRLLQCKPKGAVAFNRLIQYALSMVTGESIKLYVAITVRVVELLEKFFEMHRDDAINALKIYKMSGSQAEMLSKFFAACKSLDFARGQKFINIKEPPASFIATMEEYIKEAPSTLMLEYNVDDDEKGVSANESAASVGDLLSTDNQNADSENKTDPSPESNEAAAPSQAADLLGLYDLLTGASEFEENSLALAVVPAENSVNSSNDENGASSVTGWEVALFTEPETSNDNVVAESTFTEQEAGQAGKLDLSKLDNLYDEAIVGIQQNAAYKIGQVVSNPFDFQASHDSQYNMAMAPSNMQNASCVPPNMAYPIPSQMSCMTYQDYYMMQQQLQLQQLQLQHQQLQQQQQQEASMMNKKSTNPFELDEANILPSHPNQSTSPGLNVGD